MEESLMKNEIKAIEEKQRNYGYTSFGLRSLLPKRVNYRAYPKVSYLGNPRTYIPNAYY